MIERTLKRSLGQMTYGVDVVSCRSGDTVRAFTSTWTHQLSFAHPIVATSVSPKHDTYRLIESEGWFAVSLLAGDQIEEAQYFSYPAHRFRRIGDYLDDVDGTPVVRGCVAWLRCQVLEEVPIRDHMLFVGEVVAYGEGRLDAPALTYSSRKGWRIAETPARPPGESVRDRLLAMLEDAPGES